MGLQLGSQPARAFAGDHGWDAAYPRKNSPAGNTEQFALQPAAAAACWQPARQAQQVHRGLAHSEGAHRANVQVGRRDLEEGVRLGGPGAFRGLQNLHIRVQEERPQIWSEGKRVYVTVAGLRDPSVCSRS